MKEHPETAGSLKQLWHFVLHLRWHYQLFILSGGFLLGGFLSPSLQIQPFLIQFLNVHLLLFGGATAYNSFWDKDEGPVGGLRQPPPMKRWMWLASLLLQMLGLMLAIPLGSLYVSIYAFSIFLFWLYSTPLFRWKGRPIKSLFAIGLSTGCNSVLLGFLAAGHTHLTLLVILAAFGVSLMLLSLYPISQIYQRDEDLRRGDLTFVVKYGDLAVAQFFDFAYFIGLIFVVVSILYSHLYIGLTFGLLGVITGFFVRKQVRSLTAREEEYPRVMRIKYGTSLAFVIFLVAVLILKHLPLSGISSVVDLLMK